jgi:hypothetical protein
MKTRAQTRNHAQANLPIVAPVIHHDQRRIPIEFGHPLERQSTLGDVPRRI